MIFEYIKAIFLGIIEGVTVYALSAENLNRPQEELDGLFNLIREHFAPSFARLCKNGIRLKILGDISLLPKDVQQIVTDAEKDSANFTGKGINVALCYGARQEILRAVNQAVGQGKTVTEEEFSALLYTKDCPDPDLIIRTGKEKRISNFLLYQAAYSEFYFSDKMFPDFSDKNLDDAIKDFSMRTRRFGKTDEQCQEEHK